MSTYTLRHEVRIDSDQLLNLFLGQGNLEITSEGETIVLDTVRSRHLLREVDGVDIHSVEVEGSTKSPKEGQYVSGVATLQSPNDNKSFLLSLELNIENSFS